MVNRLPLGQDFERLFHRSPENLLNISGFHTNSVHSNPIAISVVYLTLGEVQVGNMVVLLSPSPTFQIEYSGVVVINCFQVKMAKLCRWTELTEVCLRTFQPPADILDRLLSYKLIRDD